MGCKNLQKETVELQRETQQLRDTEKKARADLAQGFTDSINDVKERMDKQAGQRVECMTRNDELKNTCRALAEQYEERGKQLAAQQSQRDLEMSMLNEQLKEKEAAYKKDLEAATAVARERAILAESVKGLQEQLSTYKGKLSSFQGSLNRSTKVMKQYTQEKNKMERHVEALEKEKKPLLEKHEKRMAIAEKEKEAAVKEKELAETRCK